MYRWIIDLSKVRGDRFGSVDRLGKDKETAGQIR
jgi:hypothetical protein